MCRRAGGRTECQHRPLAWEALIRRPIRRGRISGVIPPVIPRSLPKFFFRDLDKVGGICMGVQMQGGGGVGVRAVTHVYWFVTYVYRFVTGLYICNGFMLPVCYCCVLVCYGCVPVCYHVDHQISLTCAYPPVCQNQKQMQIVLRFSLPRGGGSWYDGD